MHAPHPHPPTTTTKKNGVQQVSAYTTASRVRFLLLHDGRGDDLVKGFFRDVYELWLRVSVPRV